MSEPERPPQQGVDIDANQFAEMVAAASDEQIEQGLAANRDLLLGELFRRMPEHFNPAKAGDTRAVIEWRILGRPDGGQDRFQVVIENHACRVVRDGDATPRVIFTIKPVDFIKLVSGNASGPMLFIVGRLKIEGELLLAARLQGFFDMPTIKGAAPPAGEVPSGSTPDAASASAKRPRSAPGG